MKSPHAALVLSGVLLACTGCQGGPGPATGTPVSSAAAASAPSGTPSAPVTASVVPSPQCTPELGGPASPCTQQQYDAMKAKDAQYAEAERVYRALTALDLKATVDGSEAPSNMGDFLAEPALSTYKQDSAAQHNQGVTASGTVTIQRLTRAPGQGAPGSLVALATCLDGHGLTLRSGDGTSLGTAKSIEAVVSFKEDAGRLKVFTQSSKEVAKC